MVIKDCVDTCKDMRVKELEVFEVAFILGYDLLQSAFANSEEPETDLTYSKCLEIAEDFVNSPYDRIDRGLYTCVCEYLEWSDSFEKIAKKYHIAY